MLMHYCHMDYDGRSPWSPSSEPQGLGEKQCFGMPGSPSNSQREEAEFAIVVRDSRRKGIGSKLIDALVPAARDRHMRIGRVPPPDPHDARFTEA